MSDSLIFWKPRIDEPSKPMPSVKSDSLSSFQLLDLDAALGARSGLLLPARFGA
jgi:hypothetical protein